jgi:hypothetical protein
MTDDDLKAVFALSAIIASDQATEVPAPVSPPDWLKW